MSESMHPLTESNISIHTGFLLQASFRQSGLERGYYFAKPIISPLPDKESTSFGRQFNDWKQFYLHTDLSELLSVCYYNKVGTKPEILYKYIINKVYFDKCGMNKKELIRTISWELTLPMSQDKITLVFDKAVEITKRTLATGEPVKWAGFGSCVMKNLPPRLFYSTHLEKYTTSKGTKRITFVPSRTK